MERQERKEVDMNWNDFLVGVITGASIIFSAGFLGMVIAKHDIKKIHREVEEKYKEESEEA